MMIPARGTGAVEATKLCCVKESFANHSSVVEMRGIGDGDTLLRCSAPPLQNGTVTASTAPVTLKSGAPA